MPPTTLRRPTLRRPTLRRASLPAALLLPLALTGCTGSAPAATAADAPADASVEVTNCGRTLTFDSTPTRVVSVYPAMTELLLALEQDERIVGHANTDLAPPTTELAERFDALEVLATAVPSQEALLAADPDLIVSDAEYWFDGERLPTMDDLAESGIPVYVNSAFCHGDPTQGTLGHLDTDLATLGELFGVPEVAARLTEQRADDLDALAASLDDAEPVPTAMLQVYDGQVYALARGLYSDVLRAGGGVNVFEDALPEGAYYGQVSAEDVVALDPAAVVLSYTDEEGRAAGEAYLRETFPTTAAVRDGRVVSVPEAAFAGGLRGVEGAELIATTLHAERG